MSKTGIIFAFGLGAAAGAVVTWLVLKKKYEQELQEEVQTFREVYSGRCTGPKESVEDISDEEEKNVEGFSDKEKAEFTQLLRRYDKGSKENDDEYDKKPYVIPPEDFDALTGYGLESLTYYADGVLADDDYEVIRDIDERIGRDSLKTFGQYEDDSVFVRNDKLKIDYEILLDVRKFSDVIKER